MTDHIQAMSSKVELLRRTDTPALMLQRWENDESGTYDDPCLELPPGVETTSRTPDGIRVLYNLTERPSFGCVSFRNLDNFHQAKAVDYLGQSVYSGALLRVADLFEHAVLLDADTGYVMVYDNLYFKYGFESGIVLECASIAEFVNTVALGSRYRDLNGPYDADDAWWLDDIWYHRLVEMGMAEGMEE